MIETTVLNFDVLYKAALKEWPKTFDFVLTYVSEDFKRYKIKNFGQIADDIGDAYIGLENEVIARWLHYSIGVIIHKAAASITYLELKNLRAELVKNHFEAALKVEYENKDNEWNVESLKLIEDYFSANAVS